MEFEKKDNIKITLIYAVLLVGPYQIFLPFFHGID